MAGRVASGDEVDGSQPTRRVVRGGLERGEKVKQLQRIPAAGGRTGNGGESGAGGKNAKEQEPILRPKDGRREAGHACSARGERAA